MKYTQGSRAKEGAERVAIFSPETLFPLLTTSVLYPRESRLRRASAPQRGAARRHKRDPPHEASLLPSNSAEFLARQPPFDCRLAVRRVSDAPRRLREAPHGDTSETRRMRHRFSRATPPSFWLGQPPFDCRLAVSRLREAPQGDTRETRRVIEKGWRCVLNSSNDASQPTQSTTATLSLVSP